MNASVTLDGPVPGIEGAVMRQVPSLPDELPDGVRVGPFAQAKPGVLLLSVPGVARYLVRDGTLIEVAVEPGADPGAVLLYLRGSARGALTLQRGELPLHAATLIPPGGTHAIAVCGPSGVGKSTLAAEFVRRGWSLIADDMTRVTRQKRSGVLVWPGDGVIKLWRDSCERSGLDTHSLLRVREEMDKFFWGVEASRQPAPLQTVIELRHGGPLALVEVMGVERMALLSENTFRRPHIVALGRVRDHLSMVGEVALTCRVARLTGARSVSLAALADRIAEI